MHVHGTGEARASSATCEHCQQPFQPRDGKNGGQRQRFCSVPCRKKANNSKRSQRLTDSSENPSLNFNNKSERLTDQPTSQNEPLQNPPPVSATSQPESKKGWRSEWEDLAHAIIIPEQPIIAVYANPHNQVVIRSQGDGGYFVEDSWVVVSRTNLRILISRLQEFERGEM
jgi:hypothetical protein